MANPVEFKLDQRDFVNTLARYRTFSRRAVPVIVNTKAFYIARRAVVETPKADSSVVKRFFNRSTQAIVGKIINARRGKRGQKGLYGDAMAEAQIMLKAARLRSVAFLKSGWIPAIKTLEKLAERPSRAAPNDRQAKIYGKAKGKASPAKGLFITRAVITNMADARHDTKEALIKFGGPALQRAMDFEAASMKEYMEEKMRAAAQEAGIKTN